MHNKANQHGALKAPRKKRATLLTPSYWRRYAKKLVQKNWGQNTDFANIRLTSTDII